MGNRDSRAFPALWLAVALTIAACTSPDGRRDDADRRDEASASFTLRLIGQRSLDHGLQFGGTTVGGLSGIDYDPATGLYYLISDDRSVKAPTRFYTARLSLDAAGFRDVALQDVVVLRQPDGTPFPVDVADAEAIRYDPPTHGLWWGSEGDRTPRPSADGTTTVMLDPFVRHAALDGRHLGEVPLDPMFRFTQDARGPRDNTTFEGISLSLDGRSLWISMEGPLLQDGRMPTMTTGAWARISRHERSADGSGEFGALAAQYAYRVDPIPSRGAWTASHAQTGVSEILAIGAARMLVLERAFVIGAGWRIRLFEADWSRATDVKDRDPLVDRSAPAAAAPPFVPMSKHLVLDFDELGIRIDNLEGLCFGPTLANGHRTLVLVADDNFNAGQSTQFVALEMIPR